MSCVNMVKASLVRVVFAIHAFIAVWRVVDAKGGDSFYWLLAVTITLLAFEGIVSLCSRRGEEMRWFCPSVFFYLCSVVPPIWILELDLASSRANASASWNATDCYSMQKFPPTNPSTKEALSRLLDIYLPLALPREQWAKILEQMLLVILIVGRWLLPKGELTRDQLSQLLLVYIAMAADIVELFEAFKEKEVIVNKELTFYILGVWTWSLSQFTLVMSATKGRKQRLGMTWTPEPEPIPVPELEEGDPETKERKSWIWDIVDMDIIAILTTVVLQDGPFLIIRMVLIFHYNVVSYLNIFFTCKNTLVATLQIYRLFVLICEKIRKKHKLAREAEEEGFGEYSDSELEGQLSSISEDEQFRLSQALRQNEEDPDFDLRKWLEEEISNHLKRRNSTVRGIPPPMTPINEEEESVKSDPATRRRSQESKRSFAPSRKPSKDKKQVKDEEKDLEVKEKKNETGKKKGKLKRETSEESSNSDSSGKKKKHKNRVKPKNPVKPKKGKEETSDESSDEESTSGTTVSTVEDAKKRKKKRLSRKRRTGRDADATLLDQLRTALMTSKKLPSRRSSMKEMGMNQFPRNISRMSLRDLALEEGDSTSDGGGRVIFQIESEIEEHPKKLWEEMERYKLKKKMKHIEGGATPKAIPPMFHCNTPSPYGMSSPQLLHSQVGSISSLRNLEKWYEGARSRAEFPPDHVDYPSGIPRMRARPPPFDTMSLHGLSRTQSVGRLDMDNASFTSLPTNKMESFV